MQKGRFIVFEGGEGSGKDTQVRLLQEKLGDSAVFTREPGGTPLGKVFRDMLLHGTHGEVALSTELFLFLADRAEHAEKVVYPALQAGKTVVSNRSWISFMAYQIYGREQFDWQPVVKECIEKIFAKCPIDLALILDMPPEVGFARMQAAGKPLDTMEKMSREAYERIRKGYLETARLIPGAIIIDASRSKEEVWKDVEKAVTSIL